MTHQLSWKKASKLCTRYSICKTLRTNASKAPRKNKTSARKITFTRDVELTLPWHTRDAESPLEQLLSRTIAFVLIRSFRICFSQQQEPNSITFLLVYYRIVSKTKLLKLFSLKKFSTEFIAWFFFAVVAVLFYMRIICSIYTY